MRSRSSIRHIHLAIYKAARAYDFRIEGQSDAIANALRSAGFDISDLFELDSLPAKCKIENAVVRDFVRKQKERINGQLQRVWRPDGGAWVHLKGRLYLLTKDPDAPDAKWRREQALQEIRDAIKGLRPGYKGYRVSIQALQQLELLVKSGEVIGLDDEMAR